MGAMRSIFLLLWSLIISVSGLWPQDSGLSAIPEPMQAPASVDLAWKVLPHRVVEDSFGRRVADRFFAVEIHIGNNTGHDLLVSGFYFRPPGERHPQSLEPNDPYSMVRGVIERDQQIGRRAMTMHVVRSFGPLLSLGGALITGSAVTVAKYGASVGIFSNGIEKGLDAAYPDHTLRQIGRLDANSFADHLVLRQNEAKRVLVFVSRETVQCPAHVRCEGQLAWSKEFSPREVKRRLGTLSLHGHELAYARRIRQDAP